MVMKKAITKRAVGAVKKSALVAFFLAINEANLTRSEGDWCPGAFIAVDCNYMLI